MEIEITKKFQKQVSKCLDKAIKKQILEVIRLANSANSLSEIKNIKKLTGFQNKYRIRIHEYRIGVELVNSIIIFAAFDHRSDIYKYFP